MSKTVEGLVTIIEPASRVPEEDVLRIMARHGLFRTVLYPFHLELNTGRSLIFTKHVRLGEYREYIHSQGQVVFFGITKDHESLIRQVAHEIANETGLKVEIQLK
ncbi:MAG TPA: hypothetical protein VGB78_09215 [Thermoplasmata archaeon]